MSQDHILKLKCAECGDVSYFSRKNKKRVERKIELKKYCPTLRKHTIHKESKK